MVLGHGAKLNRNLSSKAITDSADQPDKMARQHLARYGGLRSGIGRHSGRLSQRTGSADPRLRTKRSPAVGGLMLAASGAWLALFSGGPRMDDPIASLRPFPRSRYRLCPRSKPCSR